MDNVFHDNMLWPTVVVLPKRTGWSLWSGNGALRQLYDNLWGALWGDAPKLHPERAAKQAVARVATLATWNPAA